MAYMGKELKNSEYMYVDNRFTLVYTWNEYNIINQLSVQFSRSVLFWLYETPWTVARQAAWSMGIL